MNAIQDHFLPQLRLCCCQVLSIGCRPGYASDQYRSLSLDEFSCLNLLLSKSPREAARPVDEYILSRAHGYPGRVHRAYADWNTSELLTSFSLFVLRKHCLTL